MKIELRAAVPATVLRNGIRIGLLGGIVAVFIALTGMMQAFSVRDIISGVVTMSQILLLITFFGTAYVVVSRRGSQLAALTIATGLVAGFLASLLVVLLVAIGQVIGLGNMFISATPQMYDLLTFKQGLVNGSLILIALGLAMGAFAVAINFLPANLRRAVMLALTIVIGIGLLQDLIRVTLSDWDALTPLLKFLYESNGLSIGGAVTLFVLVTAGSYFWSTRGEDVKSRINALPTPAKTSLRWGSAIFGIIILLLLPVLLGLYISDVLDTVGLYLLMGLGLNIVVGFAGLLDLGYVAFFAIGAYTVGILTSPEHATGIIHNWWLAAPFAVIVAVFFGVALGIPVLRMRGDYLAIVTLGFGEIIRILAISDFLKPWEGGAQGIQGIPTPDIGPIQFVQQQLNLPILGRIQFTPSQMYYYLFLAGCLVVILIASRVKKSRLGRAWMAIREDEDVAQSMGINLVATKLMAFGMGAAFGGLAGAIFASKIQSVYPHSFQFIISVNILSVIIIGGMGSIPGVIVGALALVGLPELLREVGDYRYLFFGAALVFMMLVRPEGLLPEARRRLELEEKTSEDGQVPSVMKNPGVT
ncbi:MAG: branched-chain amino acid ABC transporter permease [Acidobacteriota bacterium]